MIAAIAADSVNEAIRLKKCRATWQGLRNSARKGKKALKLQRPFPSSQSQSRSPNIERWSGFFAFLRRLQ
jgi:hypothetical protein